MSDIPIKYVDRGYFASRFHRFADLQLDILDRQMSFRGLKTGKRTVYPFHDVEVNVS